MYLNPSLIFCSFSIAALVMVSTQAATFVLSYSTLPRCVSSSCLTIPLTSSVRLAKFCEVDPAAASAAFIMIWLRAPRRKMRATPPLNPRRNSIGECSALLHGSTPQLFKRRRSLPCSLRTPSPEAKQISARNDNIIRTPTPLTFGCQGVVADRLPTPSAEAVPPQVATGFECFAHLAALRLVVAELCSDNDSGATQLQQVLATRKAALGRALAQAANSAVADNVDYVGDFFLPARQQECAQDDKYSIRMKCFRASSLDELLLTTALRNEKALLQFLAQPGEGLALVGDANPPLSLHSCDALVFPAAIVSTGRHALVPIFLEPAAPGKPSSAYLDSRPAFFPSSKNHVFNVTVKGAVALTYPKTSEPILLLFSPILSRTSRMECVKPRDFDPVKLRQIVERDGYSGWKKYFSTIDSRRWQVNAIYEETIVE